MASAIEAMGMTLPGSSSFPAEEKDKMDECAAVGPVMRNLLEKDIKPRDIMTRTSFENAMVSSPAVQHRRTTLMSMFPSTPGLNNGFGRFDKRRPPPYCHRTLCWNRVNDRRLSIRVGPRSVSCGFETEREIRHERCVYAWWYT